MKIRLTHVFDDRQRLAIGRAMGCKKPATRTQCVQFVARAVADDVAYALANLLRREGKPDPHQMKLPNIEPAVEPAALERQTA